ncbi:MAG: GTP-binding protein, partial [Deltaproteobacteria bacterium]|nr:GTP-binding protein [Deltaproteobacteria bacterium]
MERKAEQLRNVALVAHGGSGKTSLAEAMLFNGKSTTRLGRVDDETSVMDFEPEELKRRITISTAFHHCDWKKHTINIIDTPGDDNFLSDTRFSMQAADGVVVLIDGTGGVKVGTDKVWAFADEQQLPRIIFVNRLDRERADFYGIMDDITSSFDVKATPLFLPIGAEDEFTGLVDLVKMKAYLFSKDGTGKFAAGHIPADMVDMAEEWREKMIENVVEANDELMEKYLEGEELSDQEIENTLFEGILAGQLAPVICGSAVLNIGVAQLMDTITKGMPSPLQRAPKKGVKPGTEEEIEREAKPDAPFSALVFKTVADPFAGKLTLMRVFSGTAGSDAALYNANKDTKEKVGQFLV